MSFPIPQCIVLRAFLQQSFAMKVHERVCFSLFDNAILLTVHSLSWFSLSELCPAVMPALQQGLGSVIARQSKVDIENIQSRRFGIETIATFNLNQNSP